MINPFKRFYDTEVEVYEKTKGSYSEKGVKTLLSAVTCDLQPMSDETENHLFGLSDGRAYKLYCDKNDSITVGRYIKFGGVFYIVTSVKIWSLGMTAVIRRCLDED